MNPASRIHTMRSNNTPSRIHRLIQLVTPSLLSGFLCIGPLIALMIGFIVFTRMRSTELYKGLLDLGPPSIAIRYNYQNVATWIDNSKLFNAIPLLAFWALIGATIYLFCLQLVKTVRAVAAFEHELSYVHANKTDLIWNEIFRSCIRLLDATGLCVLLLYTFRYLVPHAFAAARAFAIYPEPHYAYQAVGATILLSISLMIQTILIRLFLFRIRLFGYAP